MAYASKAGRAITNPDAPSAQFQCDRCGCWASRNMEGQFQFDWRGPRLMNIQIFVCSRCLDEPFPFFRPIIIPADPLPIINPRPAQTDTGGVGWGMGGWDTGGWDLGQSPVAPGNIPPGDLNEPQNVGGTFDE